MEIFCLRVKQMVAGKQFPFDRVYLARYDDRMAFDQLFRYALVLPVEGPLKKMLKNAIDKDTKEVNRPHDRNDEDADNTCWIDRLDVGEWVMAVPILPKWMNQNLPRYLVAAGWYGTEPKTKKQKERTTPFTNRAYLQTPTRKIRPICVLCPRMIMHQNGECQIGEAVCYENLPIGMGQQLEAADVDDTPNLNELEEYALTHDVDPKVSPLLRVLNE